MRVRDDEKEERIKAAVVEVILDEGFSGASMSKIAKCAGVSPATVYIYFENKETMLQEIFLEYDENLWSSVLRRASAASDSRQRIEALIRSYYDYMTQNEQIFSFVDQFAGCPALMKNCCARKNRMQVLELLQEMKEKNEVKPYSSLNLFGIIFNPVKSLRGGQADDTEELLDELVKMIESAVLV